METIKIKIPTGLSRHEEVMAISKELGKKMLPLSNTLLLGDGYEIQNLQTRIEITREDKVKPIAFKSCSICGSEFEVKKGKKAFTNYGGNVKTLLYCSENCRSTMIDLFPGRVRISKSFKPLFV